MGAAVPINDLPGSLVPADDLPGAPSARPQGDLEAQAQRMTAEETPEWERRAAAVGREMSKPFEAAGQIISHLTGNGAEADRKAQERARAMEALYKASAKDTAQRPTPDVPALGRPLADILTGANAGRLGTATAMTEGAMLPVARVPGMTGAMGRIASGGLTGAGYAAGTEPVTSGGDFATEKAKQAGQGFLGGSAVSGLAEGLGKIPGLFRARQANQQLPPRPEPSGAASGVSDYLNAANRRIREKVAFKQARAAQAARTGVEGAESRASELESGARSSGQSAVEAAQSRAAALEAEAKTKGQSEVDSASKALEDARAAGGELPTMTGGEFGTLTRDVMEGRRAELESIRDSEALPLLHDALNDGVEVNIKGIPKQIDLMLRDEKNPDVERALLKAKSALYAKKGETPESAESIMQKMQGLRPGTPAYRELATKLQTVGTEADQAARRKLDTSIRGLDSARLAIKAMLSGKGSEPADKFAQKQLGQVLDMLEDAMGKASPSYKAYLDKYHELSVPLDAYSAASGAGRRAAASVQKDKFGGDFAQSPESMGVRFFKAGDEGAAAAREFKTGTGDAEEARKAMQAYIAGRLRNTPVEKWSTFINTHEAALREFGMYDALANRTKTAAGAITALKEAEAAFKRNLAEAQKAGQAGVKEAEAGAKKAVSEAQETGKSAIKEATAKGREVTGAAGATASRVEKNLADRPLGKLGDKPLQGSDARDAINSIFEGKTRTSDLTDLVRMSRHDDAAMSNLRGSFGEWLTKADAETRVVSTKALAQRWQESREAAVSSGLMQPEHAKAVDSLVDDLLRTKSKKGLEKDVATVGGFFAGSLIGHPFMASHFVRDFAGGKGNLVQEQRKATDIIMSLAVGDAEAARKLAQPASPEAISDFRAWLQQNAGMAAGKEMAEQKPKRRDPFAMPVVP